MTWDQIEEALRKQIGLELAASSPSWTTSDYKIMVIAAGIAYDKAKDANRQAHKQAMKGTSPDKPIAGPTISVPTHLWQAVGEAEMNARICKAIRILECGTCREEERCA